MTEQFEPLVTCVVAIYNAEKYLAQGVESLLGQSYKNLEIILVDDHSTDESWELCKQYASKHKNVIAVQTKANSGGPLTGRRLGIARARGEWITFMDGDDYVKRDYIKHLVEATENGTYDIAVTGHSRLHTDGTVVEFKWKDYRQSTEERLKDFYLHFIQGKFNTDPTDTVGQNLIRADVCKRTNLDDLPANIYGEDTVMALSFLANSSGGVNFVNHHDFIWRQVPGSGSNGGFYRRADRDAFYATCDAIFSRSDIKKIVGTDIGKVSIVIPIYNVEKYLRHCLDSVLAQTYSNLEVILVDDKSPDNSGKIADEYAARDARITVIHKPKNEGLNMARATGFQASSGTYVMFVDSDDLIARDCVEFAMRTTIKHKTDFVKFNLSTFKDEQSLPSKLHSTDELNREVVVSGKKELYKTRFDSQVVGLAKSTVWGGLYRSDAVRKINWEDANYRQYEDNFWILQLFENVESGTYTSRVGYFYRYDSTYVGVLSKALTGNDMNGRTVGYLQYVKEYSDKLHQYNKKLKLELDREIEEFETWMWIERLSNLSKHAMLDAENNLEYLPAALDRLIKQYKDKKEVYSKQKLELAELHIAAEELHKENEALHGENRKLRNELRSFMSVKRSARLLLGNAKRKIKSVIK